MTASLSQSVTGRFRAFAVAGLVLFAGIVPLRGGANESTQILRDVTNIFPGDVNPCTGEVGTSTFTFSGVIHTTTTPSGSSVAKMTITGDLSFVPDNAARPSFEGHFVSNSTSTLSPYAANDTVVFVTKLTGSDGSTERFQVVAHVTVTSGGVVVSFDRPRCF